MLPSCRDPLQSECGSVSESETPAAAFARAMISEVERLRLGGRSKNKLPLSAVGGPSVAGSAVAGIGAATAGSTPLKSGASEHDVRRFWLAGEASEGSPGLLWELPICSSDPSVAPRCISVRSPMPSCIDYSLEERRDRRQRLSPLSGGRVSRLQIVVASKN